MDAHDMAKLAGINAKPRPALKPTANDSAEISMGDSRQIAMLAGLVPASGRSALAEGHLVATEDFVADALEPVSNESFLQAMTRAAGVNPALLEDGVEIDADLLPPPVLDVPFYHEPITEGAMEFYDNPVVNERVIESVRTEVPQWAIDLKEAAQMLLNRTAPAKDALRMMSDALTASESAPGATVTRTIVPPVVESEEVQAWKSYYRKSLED